MKLYDMLISDRKSRIKSDERLNICISRRFFLTLFKREISIGIKRLWIVTALSAVFFLIYNSALTAVKCARGIFSQKAVCASLLLSFLYASAALTGMSVTVSGEGATEQRDTLSARPERVTIPAAYAQSIRDYETGGGLIISKVEYDGVENCLSWQGNGGIVEYLFDINVSGDYYLEVNYHLLPQETNISGPVELGIMIDNAYPFPKARRAALNRFWRNETAIARDEYGNDIPPLQVNYEGRTTALLGDMNEAFVFHMDKGMHSLAISGINTSAVFESFVFAAAEELLPYSDIKPSETQLRETPPLATRNETGSYTVFLQGENADFKTSPTLHATSDSTSYLVNPSHPAKTRLNTIGKGTWNSAGQRLGWEFAVPNDGYYAVSVRVKQSEKVNAASLRRVYIDGMIPCKEFAAQEFPYSDKWYSKALADANGETMYIFLKAGKHTLALETVITETDSYQPLELDYAEIGTVNEGFITENPSFIRQFYFDFNAFVSSYFKPYTANDKEDKLEVLAQPGYNAVAVTENMDGFNARVEENGSLIEAAVAGRAPDAALFVSAEDAALLNRMNLLAELDVYGDDEQPTLPYEHAPYALPLTLDFPVLYYRTDIYEELGLTPPDTWDELREQAQTIAESGREIGLGSPSDILFTLLLQSGNSADFSAVSLAEPSAAKAFVEWTDLYTQYGAVQSYDLDDFRTGKTPIIIQNADFYDTLLRRAGEIRAVWDFTAVPGTMTSDGTVSRAAVGTSLSAVVFKGSDKPEAALDFVKAFASADIQTEYGRISESLFGARPSSAQRLYVLFGERTELMTQIQSLVKTPIPDTVISPEVYAINTLDSIIGGQCTAEQALAKIGVVYK